ncbi:hypothetical protein HYFRA_00006001 [Hymenoscyphus fraxineus]|uniref:Peroxidase n=1 Tax=Hymenoscyphus fraxineus TaxID=746836 RepID=A0A9N9KWI3_9HELO|nr:hypothetical protein HYFRA_00006001 [Hymenoscyphus fraxineus]
MRFSCSLVAALAITSSNALSFSNSLRLIRRSIPTPMSRFLSTRQDNSADVTSSPMFADKGGECPAVWQAVVKDFSAMFMGPDGQCTDDARAAIRECFHDCGSYTKSLGKSGGCDASLILADEVNTRSENRGLQEISVKLVAMKAKFQNVSMADLIVMASNVAVVSCPGGPRINTFIGRKDSTKPAPEGTLPSPYQDGETILKLFQDKGFDAAELAALMGAHTASKANNVPNITAGTPQDTTPGKWDIEYYGQTYKAQKGMASFPSDVSLSKQKDVGPVFKGFVNNKADWDVKFAAAMEKMQFLGGLERKDMVDCTSVLPKGTAKRDMRSAPINARVR